MTFFLWSRVEDHTTGHACQNALPGVMPLYVQGLCIEYRWGRSVCNLQLLQFIHQVTIENSKWVWSGNTTITNCRQPSGTARKSRPTTTRHQEDKLSKEIRFRKSLAQERFKSNLEFRDQIIVSSIKFWKCLAKFMIPIALLTKFLS